MSNSKLPRQTLDMAEPLHRIGPEGVSSGISLREKDFKISSVKAVKEICLHFVQKCMGKYANNKASARYIHQMADEVIGQLAGVTAQIQKHEAEPEAYQALLDEWKQNFPPSLGSAGSPKVIAAKLSKQEDDIRKLRDALNREKFQHSKDVTDIIKSMDAQLTAYRNGIMSERRQLAVTHDFQMNEHERLLAETKSGFQRELQSLTHSSSEKQLQVEKMCSLRVGELQNTIDELHAAATAKAAQYEEKIQALHRAQEDETAGLIETIKMLEGKIAMLNGAVGGSFGMGLGISGGGGRSREDGNGGDDESVVSLSISLATSGIESSYNSDPGSDADPSHSPGRARRKGRRKSNRESIKLTGVVAEGVKALKQDLAALKKDRDAQDNLIAHLRSQLENCSNENKIMQTHVHHLEQVVVELKKALDTKLRAVGASMSAVKTVTANSFPLCHTPHLLNVPSQHPSVARIKGYQQAGRF